VDSFKLANNDIIRNSGTYAITYKTSKGCDSIVYYHINLSFTPSVTLGADTCFGNKDSVVLKTAPGYTQYVWNGMNTNSPVYVVKNPGTYNVRVTNTCGIGSDTVQVLKSCEFEIFMPNAFTPNGDGLNDWFRVPKENYNRLINFTIFNRWGQKVFETKDIGKGWNGNNGEYQAPTGTYVYIIIMESLDRRKTFAKKGYVTLIR
jgi:gliding motility-associated-like protein